MPLVKANDVQLYYEIRGSSEPLVFIVGLGADISEYDKIIGALAEKYRVIAFDNRGAGRSDKPDVPYSIDMMAEDVAGLMKALKLTRANVLGHSMGGRVALALALKYQKNVQKLILVSTSARVIHAWRITWFGWIRLLVLKRKYPQPRFAFMRQRQAVRADNYADNLGDLKLPTAIMHGRKDSVVPFVASEELHTGIKHSRLLTFDGGHLFIFMKEQQAFITAIEHFLG